MADLITKTRARINPALAGVADTTLDVMIAVASDLITLFCNKYAPFVNLINPSATIQEACCQLVVYRYQSSQVNQLLESEEVVGYAYKKAKGTGAGSAPAIPQDIMDLILINQPSATPTAGGVTLE